MNSGAGVSPTEAEEAPSEIAFTNYRTLMEFTNYRTLILIDSNSILTTPY